MAGLYSKGLKNKIYIMALRTQVKYQVFSSHRVMPKREPLILGGELVYSMCSGGSGKYKLSSETW